MVAGTLPMIVAHRGASFDAPENTLAAFRLAFEQGADFIEGDFRRTADGHLVCVHDETTARCGDVDLRVAETTLTELRAVRLGRGDGPTVTGQRVPTLDEVLDIVPAGKGIFVEIKDGPGSVPLLAAALCRSTVPAGRVRVLAFDVDVVCAVRRTLPQVAVHWLVAFTRAGDAGPWEPTWPDVLRTLRHVAAAGVGVQCRVENLSASAVSTVRAAGFGVHVWTVDDPSTARFLVGCGVDSIITNRPGFLREGLSGGPTRIA